MVKVKAIYLLLLFFISVDVSAQENEAFVRKGLLKATATISPSFMLNRNINNIYVSGELEYFLEKKISVRGDCFWYRDSQQDIPFLKENSMIFFGALYHFSKKKHDLFIGIQPAAILSQPNILDTSLVNYPSQINPGISLIAGYTFYVWNYCNFFINARYLNTKYVGTHIGPIHLDEVILSAGLGFQLHTRKKQ
ncbi:MAG: hypothetical protein IPL10_07350 [Bacteroidetes bacterium]|nr:hypothetical protein [Bacteroidota bacterium]